MRWRDLSQEAFELGARGALFRVSWEARTRLHEIWSLRERQVRPVDGAESDMLAAPWTSLLPLADPASVARSVRDFIGPEAHAALAQTADAALEGRLLCFGRWFADFGNPIDWHLNPATGQHWPRKSMSSAAMRYRGGDIKLTWEAGRFPHAYYLARAAAFTPERAASYGNGLTDQIADFLEANPDGRGVHWASGQEIALRLIAWLFAFDTLLDRGPRREIAGRLLRKALVSGATQIESMLPYARFAVRNNHVLSEALGLFAAGTYLSGEAARRWRDAGLTILAEETDRQIYGDGAYLNQSHNYQRSALLTILWAATVARAAGVRLPEPCLRAMERSLTFLVAHQNAGDGRLPNYGANDGSLPGILSTCDFSDFRPLLQTLAVVVRGERLYPPGPWDEMPAWLVGPAALDMPVRPPSRKSVAFTATGYCVLRGRDQSSFNAFRCGSLRDRHSQIDMLHVDIWWRGQNVLADAGTYLYGDREWHNHFVRTGCHNTLTVDGLDQMLHRRQFNVVYWTEAAITNFVDSDDWALCAGEHYGYQRHPGRAVHHRSVIYFKDDLWVVIDRLAGVGAHDVRLHWLAGPFDHRVTDGVLELDTPQGVFSVSIVDANGRTLHGDAVSGQGSPPRGWQSRYYGEKVATPSFAFSTHMPIPATLVTILSGARHSCAVDGGSWTIETPERAGSFTMVDGTIDHVRVLR